MKEVHGSIWVHFLVANHFVCITTNGTVKKNGEAVMGRGNAKQATIVIPGIERYLGKYLNHNGNIAGHLTVLTMPAIVVFPVKQNWWEKADLYLIERSTKWLNDEATRNPSNTYHLPRPGCGNGGRDWEREVKPTSGIGFLPDNVWVHHIDNVEMNTGE